MTALTPEQARAVERRDGSLLVRAGAGTGKTTVLVERFVRAVLEDGAAVESILAITFTEKAAAEMKARVRRRFLELGRRDEGRAAEGAWISTIDGLCARILRSHALSAGIDPDFRVLDQLEADRLALEAFDGALGEFMADGVDPERIEMVAAHTPDRLRDMVRTAYSHLRSRGSAAARAPGDGGPAPGGRARAPRGGRAWRARRAGWLPAGARGERRDGASRGGTRPARRAPGGGGRGRRGPEGARAQGPREGALIGCLRGVPPSARGVPLARPRPARAARPHDAERPPGALRRALRARQARALGTRLRGPRAGVARPACRATSGCARRTRGASSTCSWTSSRTPTRSRTSCSSSSRATTCSASETRTSRSTASETPTWACSAVTTRRRRLPDGRRASRSTSGRAASSSMRSIWPSGARGAMPSSPCARRPPPASRRRVWSRASSCSWWTGPRRAGRGRSTWVPGPSARRCRLHRPGAPPRPACSPSESTS